MASSAVASFLNVKYTDQNAFAFRLDHLKSENLFVSDVKREHDIDERKRFKESLQANRDKSPGSDLGLW